MASYASGGAQKAASAKHKYSLSDGSISDSLQVQYFLWYMQKAVTNYDSSYLAYSCTQISVAALVWTP